jgi:tetratricopeptide (TPR) repeat protein
MANGEYDKALKLCNKALESPISDDEEHSHIISLKADAEINLGQLDVAIATYEHGISAIPTSNTLKLHLADIYLELGRYEKVLELTAKASPQGGKPDPDGLFLKAAAIFLMPGETAKGTPMKAASEAAINLCNQALQINNELVEAHEIKGLALFKLGRYQEALESLEAALKIDDDLHDALYFRAMTQEKLGLFDKALLSINRILRLDTKRIDARAWLVKASVLNQLKRVDEALAALDALIPSADRAVEATQEDTHMRIYRSIRLTPARAAELKKEAFALRLQILEENDRFSDIVTLLDPQLKKYQTEEPPAVSSESNQFTKAFENNSGVDVDTFISYVQALVVSENLDEALNAARWAVALFPANASAWYFKGTTAEAVGENDEADEAFDKAIAMDPSNLDYYASRAGLLIGQDQYRPALLLCQVALSREPANLLFLYLKGVAHMGLDESKEALEAFDSIITKDAAFNNYCAIEMRAQALLNDFRYREAENEYEKLLEKRGESAEGLMLQAIAVAKQKDQYNRAMGMLENAIKKYPTYVSTMPLLVLIS